MHAPLLHELPDERGVLRGEVPFLSAASAVDRAQPDAGRESDRATAARAEHQAVHSEHVSCDEHRERRSGPEAAGRKQAVLRGDRKRRDRGAYRFQHQR